MDYELAIIGGGPGGTAAGVYASRKQLKTLLLTDEWGGQSNVSAEIQNWIGTASISGSGFAEMLHKHLEAYAGEFVTIKERERATSIEKIDGGFALTGKERYTASAILIASGSTRRKLEVPGADTFDQKGLTYCASCDGPLFSGADVAVIGGGNAGFETAAQLLAYAKSVTLLHRREQFRADPVTVAKVLAHPNMRSIVNAVPVEVQGEQFVKNLRWKDTQTGEVHDLAVEGIFVEIGLIPNTDFAASIVTLNDAKQIEIDPWTQQTSTPGIWAAGDCTNIKYHQNNISAGDAVRALEDIYIALRAK